MKKVVFIEVLRIVACFLVIVNHTNSDIFMFTAPSVTWYVSLTYYFISKMAVPIFVMISGYTLLDKLDDYKKSAKRIGRMVLTLVIFTIIAYTYQYMNGTWAVFNILECFKMMFQYPLSLAYWYLYMYIGLLIMMPFLQKFVTKLNKKDCEIFIIASLFIYGAYPILEHIWPNITYTRLMDFAIFDSYIGLLMVGYYMKKYVTPSTKKLMIAIAVFLLSVVFNVLMTRREYALYGPTNFLFFDDRVLLPTLLEGISFFYIVMHIPWKGKITNVLTLVGGCTFGIFLVSDIIIDKFRFVFTDLCNKGVYPVLAVVLFEILVFAIGFVITFVMKKIPLLKKLL